MKKSIFAISVRAACLFLAVMFSASAFAATPWDRFQGKWDGLCLVSSLFQGHPKSDVVRERMVVKGSKFSLYSWDIFLDLRPVVETPQCMEGATFVLAPRSSSHGVWSSTTSSTTARGTFSISGGVLTVNGTLAVKFSVIPGGVNGTYSARIRILSSGKLSVTTTVKYTTGLLAGEVVTTRFEALKVK